MELKLATKKDFFSIYSEMEKNFVREEIRDYGAALAVMENERYSIYQIINNGTRVGFISVWELPDFAFVEHFVIYDSYRNNGLGEKTLLLLKDKFDKILLEVEPPEDEIKTRRISFYKRCGFHENPNEYYQPPYRKGDTGTMLILLSYPKGLSDFEGAKKQIYTHVYKIN